MPERVLLNLSEDHYEAVDLDDVYYFESDRHDTWVRLRGKRRRKDTRQLGAIENKVKSHGFFRIHRSYLVNLTRIRYLRRSVKADGWEVRLEPPVHTVLPVSRDRARSLVAKLS